MYYTYILRCGDDSLYTGIAADVVKRMKQHFAGASRCAKYTRSRKAKKLEAVWESSSRTQASRLEYRIKQLKRAKKLRLIEMNDMSLLKETDAELYRRFTEKELENCIEGYQQTT